MALALGESNDPRVADWLLMIARRDASDIWTRTALLCSCAATAPQLMMALWADRATPISDALGVFLGELAGVVGASKSPTAVDRVLDQLALQSVDSARVSLRDRLVLRLVRGRSRARAEARLQQRPKSPGAGLISAMIDTARSQALDDQAQESTRVEAINRLATLDPASSRDLFVELLDARQPVAVQKTAVRALSEDHGADVASLLLPRIRAFEPGVRVVAIQTLLSRASWTKTLLQAIVRNDRSRSITPVLIELADRTLLLKHRDPEIVRLAKLAFTPVATRSRTEVIAEYMAAARSKGDASRGGKIFERECMTCHRIGDRGFGLGPDLTGSPSGDSGTLVANILDPNASVVPGSVQYLVIDQDGRTYSGVIATETATSLTLRRGGGAEDSILRSRITEMASTGLSLMPEGLEKTISKAEMTDLLAFLRASHRGSDRDQQSGGQRQTLDVGTLPGLIEPED